MANVRISDLPSEATPATSDVVPIDGSTTRKATIVALVNSARPFASQVQAEAGAATTVAMNPLTTKQAIDALAPLAVEDELVPTGGTTGQALVKSSNTDNDVEWASIDSTGKQTVWIPASAMTSATTSGPAAAQVETTSNAINIPVLDFDDAADEYAHFNIAMPKSWDAGTVTFQVWWTTTASDTDGVAWALQGVAVSDNESADASWGAAVVVTDDAQSAAGEILVSEESSAVTIGGTPAADDICYFRLFRDVSDANDDMTEDARLVGVKLFYTASAANDA